MRVFIAGIDGYLGWPLAQHLAMRGHTVAGVDALLRRQWVAEMESHSALPIYSIEERQTAFAEHFWQALIFRQGDLLDYEFLYSFLKDFQPESIIHLGEMPSAAYSMIDHARAAFTQHNNVVGSLNMLWAIKAACPDAHLVKLGTMGEYGTPNLDIPEGFFEVEYRGRKDFVPFPRQAGSFYHWSKVHDSNNVMFACKIWGLRATDIMQGVVFGTRIDAPHDDPRMSTRLDFDQCFGTVINRFCCQAVIGHPLTLYGTGQQKRGFLPLRDVMRCLTLAIENPPAAGEYRVFNQFDACYSLEELAAIVQQAGEQIGLEVQVRHYSNPRHEMEQHYYNPDRHHLLDLGYQPTGDVASEVCLMLHDLLPHKSRILQKQNVLLPDIHWNGLHQRTQALETSEQEM